MFNESRDQSKSLLLAEKLTFGQNPIFHLEFSLSNIWQVFPDHPITYISVDVLCAKNKNKNILAFFNLQNTNFK